MLECKDSISKLFLETSFTGNCTGPSNNLLKNLHINFDRIASDLR